MTAPYTLIVAGHPVEFDDLETLMDAIHGTLEAEKWTSFVVELRAVEGRKA